ncbi:MAG TPA: hypothetical protein VFY14_01195, partial [Streptomyces sp.]|nr:hypothetical protein [Streptomyces sp.]
MAEDQDVIRPVELVYRPAVREVGQALRARGRLTLRSRLPGIVLPYALLVVVVSFSYSVLDDPALRRMLGALVVFSLLVGLLIFLLGRRAMVRSLYR